MRVMTKEITPGKPTTRRYAKQEKDHAVRLVFELRKELGNSQRAVVGVADQLGYGTESLRCGLPRLWRCWRCERLGMSTCSPGRDQDAFH
jgi:hypothetical protein